MTKKHFKAAAEIVKELASPSNDFEPGNVKLVYDSFVKFFKQDDNKFDTYKFERACGIIIK